MNPLPLQRRRQQTPRPTRHRIGSTPHLGLATPLQLSPPLRLPHPGVAPAVSVAAAAVTRAPILARRVLVPTAVLRRHTALLHRLRSDLRSRRTTRRLPKRSTMFPHRRRLRQGGSRPPPHSPPLARRTSLRSVEGDRRTRTAPHAAQNVTARRTAAASNHVPHRSGRPPSQQRFRKLIYCV